jgi:hypothetical protein
MEKKRKVAVAKSLTGYSCEQAVFNACRPELGLEAPAARAAAVRK